MSKRVVLLGAGHAHLEVIRQAAAFTGRGHDFVVVAPGPFWYSGLATGMLGGRYPPALDRIDVAALAARGGGRFRRDRAVAIDASTRTVRLASGETLSYDALSLNVGSEVAHAIPGAGNVYPVKPIPRLWELHQELCRRLDAGERPRVVVAGGGATGCELAANAMALAEARRGQMHLTVVAGSSLLPQLPAAAARRLRTSLERRGIRFLLGARVVRLDANCAVTSAGEQLPCDVLVNASGLKPSPLARDSGLKVAADGSLLVDAHLSALGEPSIYGAGDCIELAGRPLPKVGVHAVRQAPVLCHNLLATLAGGQRRRFEPQRRYLLIMNLGDGSGLAVRGALHWQGRAAFWLKDRIDRRFLARYRL